METFSRYWPFVRGFRRSPVNSPHKNQWRGTLMFSLICAWINGWVNTREAKRRIWDAIVLIMTSLWCGWLIWNLHDPVTWSWGWEDTLHSPVVVGYVVKTREVFLVSFHAVFSEYTNLAFPNQYKLCNRCHYTPAQRSCRGYIGFTPSVRLSVRPSIPHPVSAL